MPWPLKQQRAIFLRIKRKDGTQAAIDFMHAHGYPGKKERKPGSAKHLMRASKR